MAWFRSLSWVPAPENSCAAASLMSSGFFLPLVFTSLGFADTNSRTAQSVAFLVLSIFMLLQHGARGDLFCALAIATRFSGGFLDVLILSLLLLAHATHVSLSRHNDLPTSEILFG